MSRLFARQPRIPGVCRERANTSLLPAVAAIVRNKAAVQGKTVARIEAELISRACGYDAATGDKVRKLARKNGAR